MAKKESVKETKGDMLDMLAEMGVLNKKDEFIKTGILPLDMYLGGKNEVEEDIGLQKGKLYSISGPNGVGKSTLCLDISRRLLKGGYKGIYCDYENGVTKEALRDYKILDFTAFDPNDPRKAVSEFLDGKKTFLVINPKTFSQTALVWNSMLNKNSLNIDFGIFDSLKTIQTTYLDENIADIEQLPMGINARSQENFLPFVKNLFSKYKTVGIFVNQMRTKMGGGFSYQDEPSNNAFLYNMDVRLTMKNSKDGAIEMKFEDNMGNKYDKTVGHWIELLNKKGRLGNSHSILQFPILFGKGVSLTYLYLKLLLIHDIMIEPTRADSKTDVKLLNDTLAQYGEVVDIKESTSNGEAGLVDYVKKNLHLVEKMIVDNKWLYVEKELE